MFTTTPLAVAQNPNDPRGTMKPFRKFASLIGAMFGACLSVASCSLASTPTADFLERLVTLIYPSGPGGMGYNVKHLVDVCLEGKGEVSWEKSDSDTIMTCDRTDPLSKVRFLSRWLLRPSDVKNSDGSTVATVAIVGLAVNGQNISRSDLEILASSL